MILEKNTGFARLATRRPLDERSGANLFWPRIGRPRATKSTDVFESLRF